MNQYEEPNVENLSVEDRKLLNALPNIIDDLSATENRIFTRSMIEQIFSENRESWQLNKKTSVKSFIELLEDSGNLKEVSFKFPSRKETRYTWGDVSPFEIVISLKPNAYLTHRGAMYIHDLIAETPEMFYLNVEQNKEHQRSYDLTQEGIDRAFRNKPRVSNEIAECGGIKVCIIHGQKTGGLGVIKVVGEKGEQLSVTDIERTLIDIAVRPAYAGGASEVLNAYRKAKGKASIEKLVQTLKAMDYVYPYHQAIGFYLDKAGVYDQSELQQLQEIPVEYDFYLENKIEEPDYSDSWRVYHPREL